MARKNLLDGLMGQPTDTPSSPPAPKETIRVDPARPRYTGGAIGAVSESIAALKSRAVVDLDPNLISAGGLSDRIEHNDEDHKRLMASLKEYGQQVPILVRPHPTEVDRYQIVYGRRRVLALRDLGLSAKAMIRDLDDRALVMAQGQENATRRDLSFIEKCNFARQMQDAAYDRKAICDALNVDKTLVSRMLSVTDAVPVTLIEMIGAAPSIGRERWIKFATAMRDVQTDADSLIDLIVAHPTIDTSDARFELAADSVARRAVDRNKPPKDHTKNVTKPRSRPTVIKSHNGLDIGSFTQGEDSVTITLNRTGNGGFEDWLAEHLPDIHRDWVKRPRDE